MAIAFIYTESTNIVRVTGGTSGTPATFADFVTADRAGTATLLVATAGLSPTLALTYQIRPVEDMALLITFTVAAKTAQADYIFITGTDWRDAAQTEAIDVTAGNGAYVSTKYFKTITNIDCSDNAAGGGTQWADGTVAVTQPQWGVIWDYGDGIYRLDAKVEVGGDGSAAYFTDTNKVIIIGTFLSGGGRAFDVYALATLTLGELVNATTKSTKNGCTIKYLTTTASCHLFIARGGATVYLYSLRVDAGVKYYISNIMTSRIWNCFINGYGEILNQGASCDVYNLQITNSDKSIIKFPGTIDKATITASNYGFEHSNLAMTVTNPVFYDIATKLINCYNTLGNAFNLIDVETNIWSIGWAGGTHTGTNINRKNTVNIHVSDAAGANLATVAVVCEDQDGNTTGGFASVNTDANGDIAEQTIIRGYCDLNNSDLDSDLTKDYSPHKFTISKAGYETLILENITVDAPIVWHLELQDPVVAGISAKVKHVGIGVSI